MVVPLLEGVEGNYLMTPRPGYAHGCRPKRYQLARCKKNVCCCCASLSLLVNQILTVDNANAIIRKPQLKMKCVYRSYSKFIASPWPNPVHQQMQRFPFPWPFLNRNSKREGKSFFTFTFFPLCHVRGKSKRSSKGSLFLSVFFLIFRLKEFSLASFHFLSSQPRALNGYR